MKNAQTFLEQMRIKCEAKATEMAKLELSLWDADHYMGLVKLGMSASQIAEHKTRLDNDAIGIYYKETA